MLQAPVSDDKKTKPEASRSEVEREPERLMGLTGWGDRSALGASRAQNDRRGAKQRVVGNQAVLRMTQGQGGFLQRKCACGNDAGGGGTCVECQVKQGLALQKKLRISEPGDKYEQEADRVANQVMQMPLSEIYLYSSIGQIQRQNRSESEKFNQQSIVGSNISDSETSQLTSGILSSNGQPLDSTSRAFMEPRFGQDFSHIRIHTGIQADESARSLHANAYTLGSHIVFANDKYQPNTVSGQHLLAHELTHTMQQVGDSKIQRDCSNPNFCTPYATSAEAASTEWWIRNTYMPLEGLPTYGTEVMNLYESFLNRVPGDSLAPEVFSSASSYLVSSFKDSGDTSSDQDNVIDLIGFRLSRAPGPLSDNRPTMMSLSNFLSATEMDNRPINYSNPFSVAGHIAGGIGSSAAGPDYRKITYGNVTLEKVPIIGNTGYVSVETTLQYEVFDAVDFCPGDCGSFAEQIITIPMSRLEASGAAHDVPFKVIFTPDSRSKRFWY
jgi:Domain of unknown function (DUF4157)